MDHKLHLIGNGTKKANRILSDTTERMSFMMPSIPASINQALTGVSCGTFIKRIKFYKQLEKEIKNNECFFLKRPL